MLVRNETRKLKANDQSGFLAAEWVAFFGFLLIPTMFLAASIVGFPQRAGVAQSAAAEAARAGTEMSNAAEAKFVAENTLRQVIADELQITWSQADALIVPGASSVTVDWRQGGRVEVSVKLKAPLLLGVSNVAVPVCCSGHHVARLEDYRSTA